MSSTEIPPSQSADVVPAEEAVAASPSHHATESSSRHSTPATSTGEPVAFGDQPQPSSPKTDPTEQSQSSSPKRTPKVDALASIKPAYFYNSDGGSGQDGVPVFEPTIEQFEDFYAFCEAIDKWGMQSGIVKVVPPREWREALPDLRPRASQTDESQADISKVRIRNAIVQHFTAAGSGVWRQTNITRTAKTWNAKQWADTCISRDQKGPEMERMKWKAEIDGATNGGWGHRVIGSKDNSHSAALEEDGVRTRSGRAPRASGSSLDVKANNKRKRSQDQSRRSPSPSSPPASQASGPSSSPVKAQESMEDWQNFDYQNTWLKEGLSQEQIARLDSTSTFKQSCQAKSEAQASELPQLPVPADWNRQTCREIESEYWRSLNFGKPPMYGADLKGSLFDDRTKHWNVAHLDNILTRLKLRKKLPGVNTPYLYWGMWRATFAWHVEDMDLYSINYIHFGAPKQWYSIRQADRHRFESAMAGTFPADSHRCPHFMRHKSYLASPSFLASHGIRPLKLVHNAGEFVITYPYGYHSGFNLGFNCAESVNFALESWLDIGRKANYCHCDQSQNSVVMDVDALLEESKEMEELEHKRDLRKAKEGGTAKALDESELERRRLMNDKVRERRKHTRDQAVLTQAPSTSSMLNSGGSAHYIDPKDASISPCVFCPSNVEEDLVRTPRSIPTDNSRLHRMSGRHAHRLCASFIPETWFGKEGGDDVVCGIEGIDKARFALKCQICPNTSLSKLYPKIQCTRGKCPRSAHVSCAMIEEHGWFVDLCTTEVADRLEAKKNTSASGTADDDRLVVLCRSHNPLFREAEEARKAELLRERVLALPVPSMIKIKSSGGMFEALMVEVREAEDEVVIEDDHRPSTVKFQNILFDVKPEVQPGSVEEKDSTVAAEEGQEVGTKRPRRASRKTASTTVIDAQEKKDDITPSSPLQAEDANIQAPKAAAVTKPRAKRTKKQTVPPVLPRADVPTSSQAAGAIDARTFYASQPSVQYSHAYHPQQRYQPPNQPPYNQHESRPPYAATGPMIHGYHMTEFASAPRSSAGGYHEQPFVPSQYSSQHAHVDRGRDSAAGLGSQPQYNSAVISHFDPIERAPVLPTYAKPLSQQQPYPSFEHRYAPVPETALQHHHQHPYHAYPPHRYPAQHQAYAHPPRQASQYKYGHSAPHYAPSAPHYAPSASHYPRP